MKNYEVFCPRCGLVLDDTFYSVEYASKNAVFVENHAVIPLRKKKSYSREEKKIASVIAILKREGNGLPKRTIEKAILLAKKSLKSGIFNGVDRLRISRVVLYVAAKSDCIDVPIRLKRKEKRLARTLEMFLGGENDPNRKLKNYMNHLISKMCNFGVCIDSYTAQKIQEDALKLVARGCIPKNAVAAAFYAHALENKISISKYSKECGIPKTSLSRLISMIKITPTNNDPAMKPVSLYIPY